MELSPHEGREVRAARNQSLFRSVNEKMASLNEAFAETLRTFAIACECDDLACVEMIEITPDHYRAVRAEPRRFVIRAEHINQDVEVVVQRSPDYVVVEKVDAAGETAEQLAADVSSAGAGT